MENNWTYKQTIKNLISSILQTFFSFLHFSFKENEEWLNVIALSMYCTKYYEYNALKELSYISLPMP